MKRLHRFEAGLLSAIVVALPACGGGDTEATAPALTPAELSSAIEAACDASFARCGCAASLGTAEDQTCVAVESYILGEDIARLSEMLQRGAITYDGEVVAACLEQLAAADCDTPSPPCGGLRNVLWEAVTPAVPLGGACATTFECAEGACARPDGTQPLGHCVSAGEGDPCVVWCGDAVQVSSDGEVPASCTKSCINRLSPSGPWDACTCERLPLPGKTVGEACVDAPEPCVDDAWCDPESDRCVPLGELGAPCADGFALFRDGRVPYPVPTCVQGLFCDPATSTCVAQKTSSDACDTGTPHDQCANGCGIDGHCVPRMCR